ncbi:MAG: hydrogenase nickel incorporation protein HypB [Coriobacteriia bacterium]|nr:hydrogenase nickel incorporation protein HypB [Coriobacteriia bacterium]MCL2746386.1 hydrogenase nickel incorporation protein HypB [Coriobacteriia bacterium]MCL2870160.1 hydrogenase nickel incorporation protein HypB [Coriobacteriia bacterium]
MTHIDINKPILDKNDRLAQSNKELLHKKGIFTLDLMASPGAGKTTAILATIEALKDRYNIAVIEGDIASNVDALKIKAAGIPAVQINTGGICHLESDMIRSALDQLPLDNLDFIIIENVGNLVCTTEFYLGEDAKVMILSVPEGDDKPHKYPGIFQTSKAVLVSKTDTLPVFDFDMDDFNKTVGSLNPKAPIFPVSAKSGEGMSDWTEWLVAQIEAKRLS